MRFKGKSGVEQEVTITDRTLRRVVRQLQELPGQALFQYVNGDGNPHHVTSNDVNDYIREATGGEFTAKHFRTWGASVIAFETLLDRRQTNEDQRQRPWSSRSPKRSAIPSAISRKAYVHPALIEAVKERPRDPLGGMERPRARKWLSECEVGLIQFLARSGKRNAARPKRRQLDRRAPASQERGDGMAIRYASLAGANRDGLLIGLVVGVALVAVMLVLRRLGRGAVARDPDSLSWRTVIGRCSPRPASSS